MVSYKREPSVCCYTVFDAAGRGLLVEADCCRVKALKRLGCTFAAVTPREVVADLVHVSLMFRQVRNENGEGLMLRRPAVPYSTKRTNDVLKVKACPITGELRWQERRRVA